MILPERKKDVHRVSGHLGSISSHCKTIYFGIFGLDMKHTQTYLKIIIQELNMI